MSNHNVTPPNVEESSNVEEYSPSPPLADPSQGLLDPTPHVQFATYPPDDTTYPPDDKLPPWKDNRKGFGFLVFHLHILILSYYLGERWVPFPLRPWFWIPFLLSLVGTALALEVALHFTNENLGMYQFLVYPRCRI
jgi:hypothetical protein